MASPVPEPLRVFLLPFLCPGHMIPMLDLATLLSRRGVSATIITTPGNAPLVLPTITRSHSPSSNSSSLPIPIRLLLISFPSPAPAAENLASLPTSAFDSLWSATFSLGQPLLDLLLRHPLPHCLVSDSIFSWSADIAASLRIPRLVFDGPGAFALCVQEALEHSFNESDSNFFIVDHLPHRIELTKSQLPETFFYPSILDDRRAAEAKSHGVITNTFRELEPHYAALLGAKRRAWFVGPVSLCHRDGDARPDNLDSSSSPWLSWLEGRPEGSVLYVCFGSLSELGAHQLEEISAGLENSGHPFIWAAKNAGEWLTRSSGNGMVRGGWAPQVAILGHPAVGGFMTHCGWNSTLEAVAAGVPMVALPLFYEQYINEKLITEVLGIGARVRGRGDGGENLMMGEAVERLKREEVAAAVGKVMGGGEEAEGMRRRAREYGEKARAAMEKGGSSDEDLDRLIQELVALREEEEEEEGRSCKIPLNKIEVETA